MKQFAEKVQITLTALLKEDVQITTQLKLNGICLTGLIIKNAESNISPTIYLNTYYDRYLKTGDLSAVVTSIVKEYQDYKLTTTFDMEWFRDFNQVKDKICYRLINYDLNRELLDSVPHIKYLDLAKTYYVPCKLNDTSSGSITIYNSHLDMWGTTAEELDILAENNTPRLHAPSFKRIGDCLCELAGTGELPDDESTDVPQILSHMYVLTNSQNSNGAAAICYQAPLRDFSLKTGKDIIILPSSIHETILLPLENTDNINSLKEMVKSVNETQVDPTERLSDSVYIYRKGTGQIEIA
ncbi:MAG: hypothetical protein HFH89_07015 [Lachnospiraceae bacterium]|nr:hypothetical protein [Lachnospiraceae bacterium]